MLNPLCGLGCRGKPLPGVEARPAVAAGRLWRRPSAVTASKTAALRTLCQALVPDSSKADITQVGPNLCRWRLPS